MFFVTTTRQGRLDLRTPCSVASLVHYGTGQNRTIRSGNPSWRSRDVELEREGDPCPWSVPKSLKSSRIAGPAARVDYLAHCEEGMSVAATVPSENKAASVASMARDARTVSQVI